jgi:hypothetical protein
VKREIIGRPPPAGEGRYHGCDFDLPEGVRRLTVRVEYERESNNYLALLLFDPHGWRGEAKSYDQHGATGLALEFGEHTSPGAIPGPLPPGRWFAQIVAIYGSLPEAYRLIVEAGIDGEAASTPGTEEAFFPAFSRSFTPHAGWYRGDFHLHSTFSDGWYTPEELVDMALREGVDFIAITDHNAIGSLRSFAARGGIPVLPGIEVSFPEGHANIFGLQSWLDWRVGYGGLTMLDVLRRAREQHLLVSINHPTLAPWDWRLPATPLQAVDCLEVCNDPSYPGNDQASVEALALWTACLNAGHRLTALGGSDAFHHPPGQSYRGTAERLAQPSTYVYARELSVQAILDGVRAGRAYVTQGPQLTFEGSAGGRVLAIGDQAEAGEGAITIRATATGLAPDYVLHLVRCGQAVATVAAGVAEAALTYTAPGEDAAGTWYRLDVLSGKGQFVATTNPIYIGASQPQPLTFGEALALAHQGRG